MWLQIEQARRLCQQKNPNCFHHPFPECYNIAPICPETFTEGVKGGSAMGGTATGKARVCCALFYQNYIVDVIPWIWVTAYQSWQAISRSQSGVGLQAPKAFTFG